MSEHRFFLYYYSEVSAEVSITSSDGQFSVIADHPTDTVGIDCWFHFVDYETDTNVIERTSDELELAMADVADELSPGGMGILEHHDVDNTRMQFFTDFMCAATTGVYSIYGDRDNEYYHPAGEWLYSIASKENN